MNQPRSEITPDQALAERATRELARRHLADFIAYVLPWWNASPVHELVCREAEAVYEYVESGGEKGTGALIIEMPPQHGKTTIISRGFAAWLLGKRPDSRIMLTAYAADLAGDNSRDVRDIVNGPRFKAIFGENSIMEEPVEIADDAFARANWRLGGEARGGVLAVGVGGGATGRPVDLVVVDDPFKNREEADSETERAKKYKWLTTSILSRLRKGSAIVMIHTRWHREDTIGESLKAMATDPRARKWKVISLPALPLEIDEYARSEVEQRQSMLEGLWKPFADPLGRTAGCPQPLWEAEFPIGVLETIKATYEASGQLAEWYALYQQQPRPTDGAFFSSKDFKIVPKAPEGLTWYRYCDLALGKTQTADWNTSLAGAMDKYGNLFYRDMIRAHALRDFFEMVKTGMLDERERGTIWGFEDVAFQSLVFQRFTADQELAAVAMTEVRPDGDKVRRARALQYRAKAGAVYLVEGPWIQPFLIELLDFPNGRKDDQVDTASGDLQMMGGSAKPLPAKQPEMPSRWRDQSGSGAAVTGTSEEDGSRWRKY